MDFNNRELALIIILGVALFFSLLKKDIRQSIEGIFKVLRGRLLVVFELSIAYILLCLIFLAKIGYWNSSLTKSTILWIVFTSISYLMTVVKRSLEEDFILRIIYDQLKLIVLIEFISNTYVYDLYVELILQLTLIFLGIMVTVASREEKYRKANKLFQALLSFLGLILFSLTIYSIITEYKEFFNIEYLRQIILPPILTILYSPFIYILALYANYEVYFIRISHFNQNSPYTRYAKIRVLFKCNVQITKLRRFMKRYPIIEYQTKNDIIQLMRNAI